MNSCEEVKKAGLAFAEALGKGLEEGKGQTMTREEAKEVLSTYDMSEDNDDVEFKDAIALAIKALEQEPCEDAISRQAVLKQINCWIGSGEYRCTNATHYLTERVKYLPPVTQEPKTGRWIVEVWNNREHRSCSVCQRVVNYEPCYHYCPYCGAKMESEG